MLAGFSGFILCESCMLPVFFVIFSPKLLLFDFVAAFTGTIFLFISKLLKNYLWFDAAFLLCQPSVDKCFEASQRKSIGAYFELSYNFTGLCIEEG